MPSQWERDQSSPVSPFGSEAAAAVRRYTRVLRDVRCVVSLFIKHSCHVCGIVIGESFMWDRKREIFIISVAANVIEHQYFSILIFLLLLIWSAYQETYERMVGQSALNNLIIFAFHESCSAWKRMHYRRRLYHRGYCVLNIVGAVVTNEFVCHFPAEHGVVFMHCSSSFLTFFAALIKHFG